MNNLANILLLVVFIALIYFMMIRPQKKKEKADNEMRNSLAVGDEVMTIGGVIGKIVKINEKTIIITTGAEKNKIEFIKTAVASVNKGEGGSNKPANKKAEKKAEVVEEKAPDREKKITPKKLGKKAEQTAEAKAEEKAE